MMKADSPHRSDVTAVLVTAGLLMVSSLALAAGGMPRLFPGCETLPSVTTRRIAEADVLRIRGDAPRSTTAAQSGRRAPEGGAPATAERPVREARRSVAAASSPRAAASAERRVASAPRPTERETVTPLIREQSGRYAAPSRAVAAAAIQESPAPTAGSPGDVRRATGEREAAPRLRDSSRSARKADVRVAARKSEPGKAEARRTRDASKQAAHAERRREAVHGAGRKSGRDGIAATARHRQERAAATPKRDRNATSRGAKEES